MEKQPLKKEDSNLNRQKLQKRNTQNFKKWQALLKLKTQWIGLSEQIN